MAQELGRPDPPGGPRPTNPFVAFRDEDVGGCVVRRFEEQVARGPGRVALAQGGRRLTYAQLNARANRLARQIVEAFPESRYSPDAPAVALLFEHGADMVAALLGALKAGRAYVPLEPREPAARLAAIVDDCRAPVLLAGEGQRELAAGLASRAAAAPRVVVAETERDGDEGGANLGVEVDPARPAYILYTSGSTGRPKGVVQTRQYVMQLARSFTNSLRLCEDDAITLLPPFTFSASVMDVFGALLNGARLLALDMKSHGLPELGATLARERATVLHCVPSLFRAFAKGAAPAEVASLRLVYLAGEPALEEDLRLYRERLPDGCLFVNALGCTEFNVCRQFFAGKATRLDSARVPVGGPALDVDVLVLDASRRPAPAGAEGEIAVRSRFLSARYWGEPRLTSERFVDDHCGPGERLYLTGDLGVMSAGGCLTHLGRIDQQIKVRGQRVEPAEVEGALLRHEGVGQVVVALKGPPERAALCAYYTSARPLASAELRERLRARLPEYMVPAHFVRVDGFPTTHSGKVDRNALPDPTAEANAPAPIAERAALKSLEAVVRASWEGHLGRPVGPQENFFEIGGNSLLAMQVHADLRRSTGADFSLVDLFKYPTFRSLAQFLSGAPGGTRAAPLGGRREP
jgi:amino acid adenylation domain-containing protein